VVQNLVDSHRLFADLPPFIIFAILFVGVNAFVLIGRKITEGEYYNVSFSSVIGGGALMGCMSIAGHILHRPDLVLPDWLVSAKFHDVSQVISLVIGALMGLLAIYQTSLIKSKFVDLWFNFAIAPLFLYLLGTLLPVTYFQGDALEKTATFVLLVLYAVTAIMDIKSGRLHQPEWRQAHPGHNFLL
jgi:hypothetical protein